MKKHKNKTSYQLGKSLVSCRHFNDNSADSKYLKNISMFIAIVIKYILLCIYSCFNQRAVVIKT